MQFDRESPDISTLVAMSYFIGNANSGKEREFIGEGDKGNNRDQMRLDQG